MKLLIISFIWLLLSNLYVPLWGQDTLRNQQTETYQQDMNALEQLWQTPQLYLKMRWKTTTHSSPQQTSVDIMEYWKKGASYQYTLSTTPTVVVGNHQLQLVIHREQKEVLVRPHASSTSPMNLPDSVKNLPQKPNVKKNAKGNRIYTFEFQNQVLQTLVYEFQTQGTVCYPVYIKMVYQSPYGLLTTEITYQTIEKQPLYPKGIFTYLNQIKATANGYQPIGLLQNYHLIEVGDLGTLKKP